MVILEQYSPLHLDRAQKTCQSLPSGDLLQGQSSCGLLSTDKTKQILWFTRDFTAPWRVKEPLKHSNGVKLVCATRGDGGQAWQK